MLAPVMLLGTGCETAARELQGRLGHFPKMRLRLFTQRLVRAYVSFDKASEQIHSVLYAFGHRHRRKVARLFQRHLRFTDWAKDPKIGYRTINVRAETVDKSGVIPPGVHQAPLFDSCGRILRMAQNRNTEAAVRDRHERR